MKKHEEAEEEGKPERVKMERSGYEINKSQIPSYNSSLLPEVVDELNNKPNTTHIIHPLPPCGKLCMN